MKDKVVIITGASSGIGKALARQFSVFGSKVVMASRNEENLRIARDQVKQNETDILTVAADVSNENDCKRIIDETLKKFNRIDVLINNAGVSMRALFEELDMNVFRKIMDTNFYGTVYCTRYALPHLLKSKGSVVGISSVAGKKGLPGRTAYSAGKFAMEGFLETLRIENLKKGLHVLVACPGFTATEIRSHSLLKDGSPQGGSPRDETKMMSADDVAEHIYHAVLKRRRDLILTAEGKFAVWLNKFFPSAMDKIVYNQMANEPGSPFK